MALQHRVFNVLPQGEESKGYKELEFNSLLLDLHKSSLSLLTFFQNFTPVTCSIQVQNILCSQIPIHIFLPIFGILVTKETFIFEFPF